MRGVNRERIIRVLLNTPDGTLTKYRVAKEAQCSISWTMEYLVKLKQLELVEGTKVLDIHELLTYWAKITRKPMRLEFFHHDPDQILRDIKCEFALTTYRAENLTNNYLFPTRTDIYVHQKDLNVWKQAISKGGLVGKGNIRLLISDSHVFYKKKRVRGLWIVSAPQLLLDLMMEGGVAREAYEIMVKRYVRQN
ncbi:MAG: hypothetical protein KAU14_07775 [Thermoplasmata archaeon]|nr:hypothetical protein [Thermoplasmata archaeon]